MSRLSRITLLVLLLACSCTGRKHIPSGILKPAQMENVLNDVVVAEGYAESYLFKDSSKTKEDWMNGELDKVLAIHKVSQETFLKSYDFYKHRPDLLKPITDSINERSQRNRERTFDRTIRKTLE